MWPSEDELEVRLMMDLIRHVTGRCTGSTTALADEDHQKGFTHSVHAESR